MGIVKGGILGTVIQKVANVVFQKWKSLNTVREKVDPANPQTPKQVFQRDRFSFITILGRLINDFVIRPFWKYLATGTTTEWNEFFSTNIPLQPVFVDEVTPYVPDFSAVEVTEGLLEPVVLSTSPTYEIATGEIEASWPVAVIGNGLATDKVALLIIDEENGIAFIKNDGIVIRSAGAIILDIGLGRTSTSLHAYLFCYRGVGAEIEVANSNYSVVVDL